MVSKMKKVLLILVMELMLLYPAEEVNLETVVEPPASIQKNIAINKDEGNKVLPSQEIDNNSKEKTEEKAQEKAQEIAQVIPSPTKEIPERDEAKSIARHDERKTVQVFEATAYCSCVKCCGKSDGITKSGVKVHKGTLAVDPKVIPLGTKVYIEGMGWFIAEDTGNFSGKRVDIYMETHEKALQFGRKKVNVVI